MIISDDELLGLVLKTGLIDQKKFLEVATYAKNANINLVDAFIEKDVISDEQIGILIADHLKIPFVVLGKITIPDEVFHIIPEKVARKYKVIPFARDQAGIKLAMADPHNDEIALLIAKKTGQNVSRFMATERDIYNTFRIYRKELQRTFDKLLNVQAEKGTNIVATNVPMEKLVDLLINYAYQDKASDIHIEPQIKESLVRFRIDGILQDVLFLPKALHDQVVTRIKVLSRLRTDEHLSPQDGKMRITLDEEDLDIRVSIIPIADGEKAVLRLLASHYRQFSLQDLGMSPKDLQKVESAFTKSYGMVLSTGPTGSGKSTSIYAILKILNTREKNITTIEDPVEYRLKGINQIQVNSKTNLTFASGLRSILRQDPNIIFVGEIRDSETAGIAVNAALTGHLVLSTLHTNDAATALPRLTDMKVEPFLVASTVNVIIAQRLIRKICEMCRVSMTVSQEELFKQLPSELVKSHFGDTPSYRFYQGQGCKICHFTGYAGRLGVFEVLKISKEIKKLITEKRDSDVIVRQAIAEGMSTMLDDGLDKVIKGLTTIEEVLRATKIETA
ncbi:MAG: type II/IV secretion system protein [Candidatus Levybacteria bacterium]|nr:type II/IV secretion system protein [Candidatus Levybacteria bacterium]